MNRISINLKKGECIDFTDPEDLPKDQLEEKLSSLFSINNVAILKTESTSIIIRPSDISSVRIEELNDIKVEEVIKDTELVKIPPKEEPQESIDIIKDVS